MAEFAGSSSEMRAKSSDWNLACDVQLRKRLELTFSKFQQRAQALTESIDEIDAKMTATAGKLGNLNQLQSSQFIILYLMYVCRKCYQ